MDRPEPLPTNDETAPDRGPRLDRERQLLAEAFADLAAGRLVDSTEVDAWIEGIGTDHERPPPRASR